MGFYEDLFHYRCAGSLLQIHMYSPTKSIIAQKTGEYRCTGAHSTKKCVVGVVKAIHVGVSNIINYIEIN